MIYEEFEESLVGFEVFKAVIKKNYNEKEVFLKLLDKVYQTI